MEEGQKKKSNLAIGFMVSIVALVVIIAIVWGVMAIWGGGTKSAQAKAEKFINQELLAGQGVATVKIVGKSAGLYKLEVEYQGQKIESYMTKDGSKFFPQAYEMNPVAPETGSVAGEQSSAIELPKTDKPVVELFVMSYCPYGTQIEKGMIPAIEALGNKVDFKLKFVSYTMHGDKENQENLRQYCIDKEQNGKLFTYLKCFLKAGETASCLKSSGVDEKKLTTCMEATAKKYNVTGEAFEVQKADNEKYGVQGSPALVINGVTASSGRDSASLLSTICSAFKTAPSECQKVLSAASPSAGFGEGTATGATDASCE